MGGWWTGLGGPVPQPNGACTKIVTRYGTDLDIVYEDPVCWGKGYIRFITGTKRCSRTNIVDVND
jgi:hypothetical protein